MGYVSLCSGKLSPVIRPRKVQKTQGFLLQTGIRTLYKVQNRTQYLLHTQESPESAHGIGFVLTSGNISGSSPTVCRFGPFAVAAKVND